MICECAWRTVVEPCNPHQIAYAVVLLLLVTGAALRYVMKPAPLVGLNQLMFCACACMFLVTCEQTAPYDPRQLDRWFEAMLQGALAVTASVYAELIGGRRQRNRLPPARVC